MMISPIRARRRGNAFNLLLLFLFFSAGGAALGWFAFTFGGERSARYSGQGMGPRRGETMREYNERFFTRGKVGLVLGAVVGAGFVFFTLMEEKESRSPRKSSRPPDHELPPEFRRNAPPEP